MEYAKAGIIRELKDEVHWIAESKIISLFVINLS
jgi:hypothetical protein